MTIPVWTELSPELLAHCLLLLTFDEVLRLYEILRPKISWNDCIWKPFYRRMGFSVDDWDGENGLQEILYRRRLLLNYCLEARRIHDGRHHTDPPQIRILRRRHLVGSSDYRKSRRQRVNHAAVFSFALVSNGVAPCLSIVDIDNRLRLTIRRQDGTTMEETMVPILLLQEVLQEDVTVEAVVQQRNWTVIVVTHDNDDVRELLWHDGSSSQATSLQRTGVGKNTVLVNLVRFQGIPMACLQKENVLEFQPLQQCNTHPIRNRTIDTQNCIVEAVATTVDETTILFVSRKPHASNILDGFLTIIGKDVKISIDIQAAVERILQDRDASLLSLLTEPPGMGFPLMSRPTIRRTELWTNDSIVLTFHCMHGDRAIANAGISLALVWDLDTWHLVALIHLPVASFPLPKCHLDNNRLVIFAQDHFGPIVLFYQMLQPDHTVPPVMAGSGGLHSFGKTERLRFVSRIRPTGIDCHDMSKLEMDCNERFIAMRTIRNNVPDHRPEGDGICLLDGGSR